MWLSFARTDMGQAKPFLSNDIRTEAEMSDDYDIIVEVKLTDKRGYSIEPHRDNFETMCEARSWLKAGTSAIVDLIEGGFIDGFSTLLVVRRKEVKE
jgi:hypothetical protein